MRQAERLIALRALLARVQTNAKERRAELAAMGLGPDAPRPERVASEPPEKPIAPRHRARERSPTPRGHFDDDWSSLLTRDLNDPSPERRSTPREAPPPPALPFSRVASFAPPPLPADLAPLVAPPVAHAPVSQRVDDDEKHPDSEIVRAIRLAAEQPHPVVDPRDVWTGAGPELRERRGTNPPVPPRPEDLEPDDDDEPVLDLVRLTPASSRVSSRPPPPLVDPAPAAEVEMPPPPPAASQPASAVARAPAFTPPPPLPAPPPLAARPSSPEPSLYEVEQRDSPPTLSAASYLAGRGRSRRIERTISPRKQSARRFLAALVVAAPLAGLAAWSLLDEPRRSGRDASPTTSAGSTGSVSTPPTSAPLPVRSDVPQPPTAPDPVQSAPPLAASIPPPPVAGNPRESGMLWVDTDPKSAIYVQSVESGESGRWLEVPCGMKYVRLARPGLPPPGHSFPMWLGVGQTVLIPCGGSHRVALRPD